MPTTNWLTDNLVGTAGTLLVPDHTADSGESWAAASDASGNSPKFFVANGGPAIRLRPDSGTLAAFLPSSTAPSGDMQVTAAFQLQSSGFQIGTTFKHQTSGTHVYELFDGTRWRLFHTGTGSGAAYNYNITPTYPCTHTVRTILEGSTFKSYLSVNGGAETEIFRWVFGIQNQIAQIGPIQPGFLGLGTTASDNIGYRFTSLKSEAVPTPARVNTVTVGDSYTYSQGATHEYTSYPSQLCRLLNDKYKFTNLGWAGLTSAQIISNVQATAVGLYDATRNYNIAPILCGTNDDIQNVSLATLKTNVQSLHGAMRTAGFKTIAIAIPYYASADTAHRQYITDFNTWLAANWATFADAYYDLNTAVGDPVGGTNPNYYADGTHLSDQGYGVFAAGIKTVIESLIPALAGSDVTAGAATTTTVALTWTAATGGFSSYTYHVQYGVDGEDVEYEDFGSPISGTSATVTGLTPSTVYRFRVVANDAVGAQASDGDTDTAATAALDTYPPTFGAALAGDDGTIVSILVEDDSGVAGISATLPAGSITIKVNGVTAAADLSSEGGSETFTIYATLTNSVIRTGDVVTYSFDSGVGDIADAAENHTNSVTDAPVTNGSQVTAAASPKAAALAAFGFGFGF